MATKEEKLVYFKNGRWFVVGMITGMGLSGLLYWFFLMKPLEQPISPTVSQVVDQPAVPSVSKPEKQPEEKKPDLKLEPEKKPTEQTQFEFYEKLPKDQAIRTPAPPPVSQIEQKIEKNSTPPVGSLMLQVAATVDKKAGEELLEQLKKIGFQGELQEATVNGKTWFRIRVGPYVSAQIPQAQQQLEEQGFEGILAKP